MENDNDFVLDAIFRMYTSNKKSVADGYVYTTDHEIRLNIKWFQIFTLTLKSKGHSRCLVIIQQLFPKAVEHNCFQLNVTNIAILFFFLLGKQHYCSHQLLLLLRRKFIIVYTIHATGDRAIRLWTWSSDCIVCVFNFIRLDSNCTQHFINQHQQDQISEQIIR